MTSTEITAEYVRECLTYSPESGDMVWKSRPLSHFFNSHAGKTWNTRFAGKIAGRVNGLGYRVIDLCGKEWRGHRLAWLIITGAFPSVHIDHINGIRTDNRWINLRSVSNSENLKNAKRYSCNTSGHGGVYWHKGAQKWQAQIVTSGKYVYLGLFAAKADAVYARKDAELRYGYHENHGRII